jgi:3-oxoacyl-[acyl-carrier protein] reductase
MDLQITGKSALVVGGSKGIGKAISRELAAEGAKVTVVARTQQPIDDLIAALREAGGEAVGCAADCLTHEGLDRAVATATGAFGSPDIVVYIPNVTIWGRFEEVSWQELEAGNVALVTQFARLVKAVLPHMKKQQWGRIVTIGSMAVRMLHKQLPRAVPNTYRLAHIGLSKTISDEIARHGITVNTLGTGSFATDAYPESWSKLAAQEGKTYEEILAERTRPIPVGRLGRPEEMAAVCAFLCSGRASYVTGQLYLVDGGRVESPL